VHLGLHATRWPSLLNALWCGDFKDCCTDIKCDGLAYWAGYICIHEVLTLSDFTSVNGKGPRS
jgi:hypothetical protein